MICFSFSLFKNSGHRLVFKSLQKRSIYADNGWLQGADRFAHLRPAHCKRPIDLPTSKRLTARHRSIYALMMPPRCHDASAASTVTERPGLNPGHDKDLNVWRRRRAMGPACHAWCQVQAAAPVVLVVLVVLAVLAALLLLAVLQEYACYWPVVP